MCKGAKVWSKSQAIWASVHLPTPYAWLIPQDTTLDVHQKILPLRYGVEKLPLKVVYGMHRRCKEPHTLGFGMHVYTFYQLRWYPPFHSLF